MQEDYTKNTQSLGCNEATKVTLNLQQHTTSLMLIRAEKISLIGLNN